MLLGTGCRVASLAARDAEGRGSQTRLLDSWTQWQIPGSGTPSDRAVAVPADQAQGRASLTRCCRRGVCDAGQTAVTRVSDGQDLCSPARCHVEFMDLQSIRRTNHLAISFPSSRVGLSRRTRPRSCESTSLNCRSTAMLIRLPPLVSVTRARLVQPCALSSLDFGT